MAVWRLARRQDTIVADRWDAEYFQPAYYEAHELLSASDPEEVVPLGQLISYCTNGHTPLRHDLSTGEVRFLTAEQVNDFEIEYETTKRILRNHHEGELKRTQLRPDDILVTIKGKVGNAAIVRDIPGPVNINQDVALIRPLKGIAPIFIVAYLNSSVGRLLVQRASTNQINPFLGLGSLKTIPVPIYSRKKMDEMVSRGTEILDTFSKRESDARRLYTEAESVLTAALGLDRVDLTPRLFYEDNYTRAADAARFDAEYFSPRMQNVIETLSAGGKTIGDFAPLAKRRFKATPGKNFDYIEIADIGTAGTAGSNTIAGEEAPSRATWIVKPGDIITTTVRPIRRLSAIILPEQDGFVCSSGFAVLRPHDIEPELLLAYLRLPLVAELLDLHTTASMYPAISNDDLLHMPFRLPNVQVRAKIVAKVRESFSARAESLRLLDEAKRIVETAIMKGGKA